MSDKTTVDIGMVGFVRRVFSEQPLRVTLMVVAMTVAGLLEGVGLAMLVPLLQLITPGGGAVTGGAAGLVAVVLARLGLPFTLTTVLVVCLTVVLAQQVAAMVSQKLVLGSVFLFEGDLRRRLYADVFDADWPFFLRAKSAELLNAIVFEANRVATGYQNLAQWLSGILVMVAYGLVALALSWQMTLAVGVFGALLVTVMRRRVSRATDFGIQHTDSIVALQSEALEHVAGAKLIKASGAESQTVERFSESTRQLAGIQYKNWMNSAWVKAANDTFSVAGILVGIYAAVSYLNVSIASLIVLLVIFYRLSPRLSNAQAQQHAVLSYLPALANIDAIDAEARARAERPGGCPFGSLTDSVRLEGVSFGYDTGALVLDGVDIEIPAGRTVAIVGPSGSGKTTVVDLLMTLLEPTGGRVVVDGEDLAGIDRRQWRHSIGYVAQDSSFFHASVYENIAWTCPEATEADVREAARIAYADEFIDRLPEGYDTVVGDRGARLSGGQRQRLALARAIVGRPQILVLDEATSALDAESEAKIQAAVDTLAKTMTIVIVTHRLATVRDADIIYLLQGGRLVESGSWEALSAEGHRFSELKALQELG